MGWHGTDSVEEFHEIAGDFLRSRPVEHTVPLTLVDTLRQRGPHAYGDQDPIFGWFRADGAAVRGAFLQTPPHPLYVTAAPAVPELVSLLADRPLPGVDAPPDDADAFAAAWRERTGVTLRPGRRSRLFRLDVLTPPAVPPPGVPRIAGRTDRDRLLAWMTAFHHEVGEGGQVVAGLVDDTISFGGFTLWEVDGVPVAMAGRSREEAGMIRVRAVYTPPEHRARGYGGAVTATVSQAALDAGARHVVLFTDLGNPTSNALYRRLGYRPVEDRAVIVFVS